MAASSATPCDSSWPHLSPSSSSSSSSSSLSQTLSSSIEQHVWSDIKLTSLSNSPVDLVFNNSDSSFLNQTTPSTFLTLTTSASVFHTSSSFDTTLPRDQRHMRIIKNRESAVRSRARKQAYRKGLEAEIARLTEENSRLKRQLKQLQCCSESDNPPRMATSCRTSSSPF